MVLAFTKPNETPELKSSLGGAPVELKKLFGFQRVTLSAGASKTLSFDLDAEHLAMVDSTGRTMLLNADFEVVFSRGHGEELVAEASVVPENDHPLKLKEVRTWW